MSVDSTSGVDWQRWLGRWDAQQERYVPQREERFAVMLDVLEALLPEDFLAVDIGCGPGAISQRIVRRFPHARVVAVDFDPVLLALGRGAVGDAGGRIRWVDANLNDPDWANRLGVTRVDAALSTTATHWLAPAAMIGLYRTLAAIIRTGGVFLNGDILEFVPAQQALRALAESWRERLEANTAREGWEEWWDALRQESDLHDLFEERERRMQLLPRPPKTAFDVHRGALLDAGFREVDTIWQLFDDRVLVAVR
jgi:SAM-dependent methyltransferase